MVCEKFALLEKLDSCKSGFMWLSENTHQNSFFYALHVIPKIKHKYFIVKDSKNTKVKADLTLF